MKGMHKFIQVSGRLPERSTRSGLENLALFLPPVTPPPGISRAGAVHTIESLPGF